MDIRYSQKKHLCSYDLDSRLFDSFGVEVLDLFPLRGVFVINTTEGKKVLKKIDYPKEKLAFIESSLSFVNKSFKRTMSFGKNKNGKSFTTWGKELYVLLDVLKGRECETSNPVDINIASTGVAELHLSSKGILEYFKNSNDYSNFKDYIELGAYPVELNKHLDFLEEMKEQVVRYRIKNAFDNIFLEHVDENIEEILQCAELLDATAYSELCEETNTVALCHKDLAHHNILIEQEEAYFLDFDFCTIDLKVRDLAIFIEKSIKAFDYDIERAEEIINQYCMIYSLSKEELKVLYVMLKFPTDFCSIVKNYYSGEKHWDEETFLDRLVKKVSYREAKKVFLEEYKQLYIK